jgi:hypothetical protein
MDAYSGLKAQRNLLDIVAGYAISFDEFYSGIFHNNTRRLKRWISRVVVVGRQAYLFSLSYACKNSIYHIGKILLKRYGITPQEKEVFTRNVMNIRIDNRCGSSSSCDVCNNLIIFIKEFNLSEAEVVGKNLSLLALLCLNKHLQLAKQIVKHFKMRRPEVYGDLIPAMLQLSEPPHDETPHNQARRETMLNWLKKKFIFRST